MAINGRTNTLFCQNVPTVTLEGDQSYIFDDSNSCFTQADSCSCDTTTTGDIVETINCYNNVGDGTTFAYIIPWLAPNEESLLITLDGVKQYNIAYNIQRNETNGFTVVTFSSVIPSGVSIEIFGFVVSDANRIQRFQQTAAGATTSITLPWTANSNESLILSVDGVKQNTDNYTLTYTTSGATVVTFTTAVPDGTVIEVIGLQGFAASSFLKYEDTGDGIVTDYTIPWYASTCGELIITIDGVKQHTATYTVTPVDAISTDIAFSTAPPDMSIIEIIGITGFDADLCDTCDVVGNNLGVGGNGIYSSSATSGGITTLDFLSLQGGTGITLTSGPEFITIDADTPATFQNLGAGSQLLVTPITTTIDFRSLIGGTGITLTQTGTDITIDATGDLNTLGGFDADDYVRTISNAGTGVSLIKKATGDPDSNLELYSVKAGTGIVVHRVGDDVIIADANGGNYVGVVADYVIERDDAIVGVQDTSITRTMTLPDTALAGPGKVITIKDESGLAVTNNIIINTTSSQTIDGAASSSISTNYGNLTVYTDGTDWFIIT